jgi:hypothetical protein
MRELPRLIIKAPGKGMRDAIIQIDDVQIHGVTHIDLSMDANGFNTCTIRFITGEIDVEVDRVGVGAVASLPLGS